MANKTRSKYPDIFIVLHSYVVVVSHIKIPTSNDHAIIGRTVRPTIPPVCGPSSPHIDGLRPGADSGLLGPDGEAEERNLDRNRSQAEHHDCPGARLLPQHLVSTVS